MAKRSSAKETIKAATEQLGPGLVTGAADDDPSGIATYSQAGTQFGFSLLWTVFLTTPFMIAIQLVSAEIGRVSSRTRLTSQPTSRRWGRHFSSL
jgi:Mn2+/Fe2+ NRAMP family transporter